MQDYSIGRLVHFIVLLLNICIVVALLLCQLWGRSEVKYAPMIQPLLPLLLLANLMFLVVWLVQWRLWVILPLIGFLFQLPYLKATIQILPRGHAVPEQRFFKSDSLPEIRICTYNVHGFSYGMNRLTVWQIAKLMRSNSMDVLCVQEFDIPDGGSLDSLEKVFSFFPYQAYCIQDSSLNLAIFSRYPIRTQQSIEVGKDGYHALWCDLAVGEKTVRIYNCHLQTTNFNQTRFNNAAGLWFWNYQAQAKKTNKMVATIYDNTVKRNAQIRKIDRHIQTCPYPVIVCGDLNSTPASYVYDLIRRHLTDGFMEVGRGYAYTYNQLYRLFRLDYIFYSEQLSGVEYWSVNKDFSDHNPVMMSVRLKALRDFKTSALSAR